MTPTRAASIAIAACIGLGTLALVAWWSWPTPPALTPKISAPLPPAKETSNTPPAPIEVRVVYVYPKAVKEKLDLPPAVQAQDSKQVTATGKLDAEERPYTLTSVLDTETGKSEIFARPDQQPLFGITKTGEVGVNYGISDEGAKWRLSAKQDFLRIGAARIGIAGNLDQGGDWFAGIQTRMEW